MTVCMTMFRHVLLLHFKPEATEEQKQALYDGLAKMPEVVDVIRKYEFGPDLGLVDGAPDLTLVADFDSEDDWRLYQEHPEHLKLLEELVKPVTADKHRSQYLVD